MHAIPPSATPPAESGRWLTVGLAITLAILALQIPSRGIDPDELEHLHAAFCVWQGQLPYRDFFEHHSPALYWCAQPAFWISGATLQTLWLLRTAMWCCSAGIAWFTLRIGGTVGSPRCAQVAVYWLLWSAVFQRKGLEFRPDVPATLLICGTLAVITRFQLRPQSTDFPPAPLRHDRRFWCAAALCAGLATVFTQKAVVPLVCLSLSSWIVDLLRAGRFVWPRTGLVLGAGIFAVWTLLCAAFGVAGAASELIDSTVLQLIRWPVRSQTWQHLRPTLAADTLLWLLALAGCLATCRRLAEVTAGNASRLSWSETLQRLPPQQVARVIVQGTAAGCVLSLAVVKATFPQYYLLWFPLLTLAAAAGLEEVLTAGAPRRLGGTTTFLTALTLVSWLLLIRGTLQKVTGPFPHATSSLSTANFLILSGILTGAHFAVLARGYAGMLTVRGALLASLMAYGSARTLDTWSWSNASQVAAINRLHEQIAPTETVLDGFTGLAALRPHAWYYWWLNEFSVGLVPPDRLERELRELFENHPPKGVLDDHNLIRLPAAIRQRIDRDYRAVEPAPLRIRSTVPDPRGD